MAELKSTTISGPLSGTSASFSGTSQFLENTGISTTTKFIRISNTSGDMAIGVEGSTPSQIVSGSGGIAYSTVLKTVGTTALILGTNSIAAISINGSTQAATFNGESTFNNQLNVIKSSNGSNGLMRFRSSTGSAMAPSILNVSESSATGLAMTAKPSTSIDNTNFTDAYYFNAVKDNAQSAPMDAGNLLNILNNDVSKFKVDFSGAATFSGSVTSLLGSTSANFVSNAATTGAVNAYRVSNTSGAGSFGIDNSTGGDLITGGLAYATVLQSVSNTALQFGTNQTARMTITSSGNMYVGAPIDSGAISTFVSGFNGFAAKVSNNAFFLYSGLDSSAVRTFYVLGTGDVKNTNNSYGAISDVKLKENIKDATPKLDDLLKVKIRNYNLIGDDKKQIGVIAQELEEIFPTMVDELEDFEELEVPQIDKEGNEVLNQEGKIVTTKQRVSKGTATKSVKYSVFVPILIKAIQELEAKIKILESK